MRPAEACDWVSSPNSDISAITLRTVAEEGDVPANLRCAIANEETASPESRYASTIACRIWRFLPDVGNELECEGSMGVFCLRFYSKRRPPVWVICRDLKFIRINIGLINQQVKAGIAKEACTSGVELAITIFMQCSARKCGTEAQQSKKRKKLLAKLSQLR